MGVDNEQLVRATLALLFELFWQGKTPLKIEFHQTDFSIRGHYTEGENPVL